MSGVYIVGQEVVLEGIFERVTLGTPGDINSEVDTPADPDAVTVTLVRPDGDTELATSALLNDPSDVTGDWRATFTPDLAGIWQYRVEGTGQLSAVGQGALYVQASVIPEQAS